MNHVMYQTKLLNKAIKHSNEYNHYIRTREKLKEFPELYSKANEFRKRSLLIQLGAEYNTMDDINVLYSEYADVIANPLVTDFIIAEQRIIKMMQRVDNIIFDGIDLDTSIMED